MIVIADPRDIPEYSIFQKNWNFVYCSIYLEYSRNIPYSRKTQHYHGEQFFWNIPFHEVSYSVEYSRNIPWNIPYSKILDILIVLLFFRNIPRIFHIPPISIFVLFPFYLEYSIFQKLKKYLVGAKFWNIPYSIICQQ